MLTFLFILGSLFVSFLAFVTHLAYCWYAVSTKMLVNADYEEERVYSFNFGEDVILVGLFSLIPLLNVLIFMKSAYGLSTPLFEKINNYVNTNINKINERVEEVAKSATKKK